MKKFFAKFLTILLTMTIFLSVGECREFVFVVNSSQTMNAADPQKKIFEGVAWSIANLQGDDEAAVISFSDTPTILRPLSKISAETNKIFPANYSGNSNAGDALLSAVDMLSPKFYEEKNIIFITDGEISLEDNEKTSRSLEKFQDGLQQANWAKMKVFILNLRADAPKNFKSYAELATEIPIPHTELLTALRNVIYDDFHNPHLTLPVENKKFTAEVPLTSFDKIKFFLLSTNSGTANLKNASKKLGGNFIQIFEVNSPQTNKFDFEINYPQNSGLTLDAVPSVEGILLTEVETHIFSANKLKITPVYKNNPAEKIFADNFFENKPVRVQINDAEITAVVKGGEIEVDLPSGEEIFLQKVFFEDLGVEYSGENSATIHLEGMNYFVLILAGLAILTILILSYFLQKKNQPQQEEIAKPTAEITKVEKISEVKKVSTPAKVAEESLTDDFREVPEKVSDKKLSYAGKLVIYVTKTLSDEDIAPREFNLFRFGGGEITLQKILSECNILDKVQEIGDIIITPSKRGIFLENDSDSTILKRGNLIERGRKIEIFYEDSLSITSADENSEIILRYKSLKPN